MSNVFTLGNNQHVTFPGPYPINSPSFPTLDFVATNPAQPGVAALGEQGPTPPALGGQDVWRINSVVADGKPGHEVYGNVQHDVPGTVVLQHGVSLSYGNVTLSTATPAGAYTLNGASTVTNDSTLTAWGGRYTSLGLASTFTLNGSMSVTNHSVANFDGAKLAGTGTISVGSGSTVDVGTIAAGLHVNVNKGGLLYQGANSADRINLAAGGEVLIGGATTATKEIFHEASGTLDLLNKSGAQVASLKFAPGSHEYTSTAPIHGGLLEITTNPAMAGNLHATFTS